MFPAGCEDPSTIRTERRVVDRVLMGKGGHKLARAHIPELGGFVVACREDPSAVRTERRVLDSILMDKGAYGLARSRIPEIGAVTFRACRQHSRIVRAKRRVKERTEMFKKERTEMFKGSDELA